MFLLLWRKLKHTLYRDRLQVQLQDPREGILRGLVTDGDRVSCPGCSTLLGIPKNARGDHMKCPKCTKIFKLTRHRGGCNSSSSSRDAASSSSLDAVKPTREGDTVSVSASVSSHARAAAADVWSRVATNDTSVPLLMAEEYSPLLDDVVISETPMKK